MADELTTRLVRNFTVHQIIIKRFAKAMERALLLSIANSGLVSVQNFSHGIRGTFAI